MLDDASGLGFGGAEDDGQLEAPGGELDVALIQVIQTWEAQRSNNPFGDRPSEAQHDRRAGEGVERDDVAASPDGAERAVAAVTVAADRGAEGAR